MPNSYLRRYYDIPNRPPPTPPQPISLQIYPRVAEFIPFFGGAAKHVLTNDGLTRLVIKIKCSNNSLYKVWPVFSFLDPGASRDLEISRDSGPARNDLLLIVYKEARSTDLDAKEAFKTEAVTSRLKLPLLVRDIQSARAKND